MNGFKTWGLLLLALVVAGGAFWGSKSYLQSEKDALFAQFNESVAKTVTIVVSTRDVGAGEIVSASNMATVDVPAKFLPDSAVYPQMFDQVNGRELIYPMSEGTPLLEIYLGGGVVDKFSDLIEKGKRPVTIEIDNLNSNEGMLEIGDSVDLLQLLDGDKESVMQLNVLAENIKVFATGRTRSSSIDENVTAVSDGYSDQGYATITVIVDVKIAAKIILAQANGDLLTLLRNSRDDRKLPFKYISYADLDSDSESLLIEYYSASGSSGGNITPKYISSTGRTNQPVKVIFVENTKKISTDAANKEGLK